MTPFKRTQCGADLRRGAVRDQCQCVSDAAHRRHDDDGMVAAVRCDDVGGVTERVQVSKCGTAKLVDGD